MDYMYDEQSIGRHETTTTTCDIALSHSTWFSDIFYIQAYVFYGEHAWVGVPPG